MKISFMFIFAFIILGSCKDKVDNNISAVPSTQPQEQNRIPTPSDSSPNSPQTPAPTPDLCSNVDDRAPSMNGSVEVSELGSQRSSGDATWQEAQDDCEISHYELAIGTSPGDSDILSFTNIGKVTTYQQGNLDLDTGIDYFTQVRAVDQVGNSSTPLVSSAWQIFDAKTLTDLVVWLDSSDVSSLEDGSGLSPNQAGFNGEIGLWRDISGSAAVNSFTANSNRPNWDVVDSAVKFNGTDDLLATADHPDINNSTIGQRSLSVRFKTATEVDSRQVIFEEGGGTRGLNIFIENKQVHCGFWNERNDGDGYQSFVSLAGDVVVGEKYNVTLVFDYSNYNGPSGDDGSVKCYLNSVDLGSVATTSRLFKHSGDIGLGSMNDGSRFASGTASGDGYHFKGLVYELLMYNTAHSEGEISKLHTYLEGKW